LLGQVLSDLFFLLVLLLPFVSQLIDSVVECIRMILTNLKGDAIVEFVQIDGVHFGVSFLGSLVFFDFLHLLAKSVGSEVHLGIVEVGVVLIHIITSLKCDVFIELFHIFGLQRFMIVEFVLLSLLFLHSRLKFIGSNIHLGVPEIGVVIVLSLESKAVVEFIMVNSWVVTVVFNLLFLNFLHLVGELLSGLIHLGFPEVRVMLINTLGVNLDEVL